LTEVPEGWKLVGRKPLTNPEIEFTVALKPRNLDVLERELYKVSNPKDPQNYGKWWTRKQVQDLVAPELTEQLEVESWLKSYGMKVSLQGDYQKVSGPIRSIEKLLDTQFYTFKRVSDGKLTVRLIEYSIPDHLDDTILMISGLSGFLRNKKGPKIAEDDTQGKIVPEVIWNVYNIPDQEIVFQNSSVGVIEFQNDQSYTSDDLSSFESQCLLPAVSPDHIVGPYHAKNPDGEATLDVQYAIGLAIQSDIWYWTTTGWLYDFTTEFLQTNPVPYVFSMSWGWTETGQCSVGDCNGMTSEEYVNTVNGQFLQITMMGVTILASSGDQGAPGDGDAFCRNKQDPLSSIFPGASPWVLSVGATMLTDPTPGAPYPFKSPICQSVDCSTSTTELVCSYPNALITTGGGFSTYLAQPSYQQDVVSYYLSNCTGDCALPPSTDYNAANRGFPDISGLGHNFVIIINSRKEIVDGTSCSSPLWAGIIGRWNDYRLSNGLSSIGFANPMIYQMYRDQPDAFTDITTGSNKCTELCCDIGYDCNTGWDPATGLGTPVYPKMWDYITQLP